MRTSPEVWALIRERTERSARALRSARGVSPEVWALIRERTERSARALRDLGIWRR